MKKLIFIILVFNSLYIFASSYYDGEYYVEAKKAKYGWKPFTKIIIKDKKIIKVIHDRKNSNNELASSNSEFNEKMKAASGSSPKEYSKKIPESFIKSNYSFEKMDGVAGATDSVKQFKQMMAFLLKKAEKGKTGNFKIKLKN